MNRSRSGFTLIELLVAIAVIGVLAAILFPVFSRAKDVGQRVKCASNMRQLGASFSMYASEWDGLYPSPGGLPGEHNYWSQCGTGGLTRYAGNRAGGFNTVWVCPCMKEWNSPYPVRTYSMNSFLRNPSDRPYPGSVSIVDPIRQDAIPSPRATVLLYEGYQNIDPPPANAQVPGPGLSTYRCGDWSTVKGWFPRPAGGVLHGDVPWHDEVNNYLFCDGHVKARPPGKYTSGLPFGATWEEAREWFVDKENHRRLWP